MYHMSPVAEATQHASTIKTLLVLCLLCGSTGEYAFLCEQRVPYNVKESTLL